MPGEFVGRPRPLWKILLYGILTFGIYGRVYLYRTVREIDGHQVYFLDLRLYKIALVLPFFGPLSVKFRLIRLVREVIQHDVTAPRLPVALLRLLAFIPVLPAYHATLQWHLEKHWTLHRRMDDLAGRRLMIDQLRHHAKTEADRERLAQMEEELREREGALEEARRAALALQEARIARARARRQMKAAGVREPLRERMDPTRLLERFRRRSEVTEPEAEPAPELLAGGGATEPVPEPVPKRRFGRAKAPVEATDPAPDAAPIVEAPAPEVPSKRGWFGRGAANAEPEPPGPAPEPNEGTPEESKKRFGLFRRKPPEASQAETPTEVPSDPEPAPPEPSEPQPEPEPAQEAAPRRKTRRRK